MRTDQKRKNIRILAPLTLAPESTSIDVNADSEHFEVTGYKILRPHADINVATCELGIKCDGKEASGTLIAGLGDEIAKASISSHIPLGADLEIKLEDIDLVNQRYRWRQNVLEIAARHPSIRRYLGDKQHDFPGQESRHFRVLVAEIVGDAVCGLLVRRHVQVNPEEYEDADWDTYYAQYSKYMTKFLPVAHALQCPENQLRV